ncbi:FAD-dependent monooxygenase [Streptomyces sp. LP05-1]|uniref:FAD-dependent monooxygenase n=1 Tax=Streptomyces pyxinae TaxID=2970734 RepID=A0ABT2CD93_9ACTN|nr:FAD-dependent monooxygenase [Streptomyces sp. LP05-1]MCS0635367.1 FAD-dependent monooxygenase [Streptomyces sp. LP05-1]
MQGKRVAIVGGSIAGCATALAVHRGGATEITVFERSGAHLAERGVGLAVHGERYAELEAAGYLDGDMPSAPINHRRWYVGDGTSAMGRVIDTMTFPFRTYNWGPLWRELRERVPASVEFRAATAVESVTAHSGGAGSAPGAELVTTSGTGRYDLVIGADGYRSVIREAVAGEPVRPEYAGYVAWRGAYPAERLPEAERWADDECAYVVFPGGHVIAYRIPDGRGGLRINWVLYATPPPDHDAAAALLPRPRTGAPAPGEADTTVGTASTGSAVDDGTGAVPAAARTVTETLRRRLLRLVEEQLPPYWAEMVRVTAPDELFLQPIYDFTAPRYAGGALLLAGDAATVARPHTGAGAVKALQDATALERSLTGAADWPEGLAAYDADRASVGRTMVELGRRLGHLLVEATPDWAAMDRRGLDEWWRRTDTTGSFGGRRLRGGTS